MLLGGLLSLDGKIGNHKLFVTKKTKNCLPSLAQTDLSRAIALAGTYECAPLIQMNTQRVE